MLTAPRFTTVPTKDCRDRLEAALSNDQPIAQGEKHKGAVMAIQSALADLNRGYLFSAEINGYFDSRTYDAVEAFQRDYGLIADGMVARQTMMQLDSLYAGDVVRPPRGLSIHVGVDRVDPVHYKSEHKLSCCVNDARKMRELAEGLGYDAETLENENATVSNFTGFMRRAISDLYSGDSLLLTFSGHGSQLPNNSADAEADNLDETLCFFDRMLVDDELYGLFAQFREGVRIHAVFDSCHSGTVVKRLEDQEDYHAKTLNSLQRIGEEGAEEEEEIANRPISAAGISKALEGEGDYQFAEPPKPKKDADEDIAALFTDLHAEKIPTDENKKQLEKDVWDTVYRNNKDLYDAIKNTVGPAENQQLSCSVISLSACQDSQTTPSGSLNSLFTYNIISTWGFPGFDYSYKQFHRNLVKASPADVTPVINTYGTNRAEVRLYDRPFAF